MALEKPDTMLVFSELLERGRRDETIAAAIKPMKHHWRQLLADLLTQGVRDGVYRQDMDAEAVAMIMISSFVGFCRNPDRDQSRFDRMVSELKRAIRNPGREAKRVGRTVARQQTRLSKPNSAARQSRVPSSKE